jgi:AcrR family transcriptional regulator
VTEETPLTDETPLDTRSRILRVALAEFSARGYHATSVREIAERVGVTKTAVLYHFPGKADILAALAEPMLTGLDSALAAADLADPVRARWAVIENLLEVFLTHRYLLRMSLQDLALPAASPVFDRYRDAMMRANLLVAGPDADFAGRVLAAQALAVLGDPVVLFADAPTDALRTSVLHGVRRLLADPDPSPAGAGSSAGPVTSAGAASAGVTSAGPASSAGSASSVGTAAQGQRPARGARGRSGRPSVVDPAMVRTAQRMYDEGSTAAEIAEALGVSRATIYRHLPAVDH